MRVEPALVLDDLALRGLLDLVRQVCSRRGVTALEICSRRRTRAVAAARHELWCLIREHPERRYSYPEIASIFGCDHTAILHGIGAHRARAAAASR